MAYHLHPILCISDAVSNRLLPSHLYLSTWGAVMLDDQINKIRVVTASMIHIITMGIHIV